MEGLRLVWRTSNPRLRIWQLWAHIKVNVKGGNVSRDVNWMPVGQVPWTVIHTDLAAYHHQWRTTWWRLKIYPKLTASLSTSKIQWLWSTDQRKFCALESTNLINSVCQLPMVYYKLSWRESSFTKHLWFTVVYCFPYPGLVFIFILQCLWYVCLWEELGWPTVTPWCFQSEKIEELQPLNDFLSWSWIKSLFLD